MSETMTSRVGRLASAMRAVQPRHRSAGERMAMAGAVAVPLGLLLIGLGWWGASGSAHEYEQIPFLISGGLIGVAVAVIGGFLCFGAWLARLVDRATAVAASSEELVREFSRVAAALERLDPRDTAAVVTNGAAAAAAYVATPSGTLYHRADCRTVAGRADIRTVAGGPSGLRPCRLCLPGPA